jgi:RNA-directed DNA polymerase
MEESYGEGLANHTGPESCISTGNGAGEALTGVRAGWVLSPEIKRVSGADGLLIRGKQHCPHRYGEGWAGPAGSKTPCMHGSFLRGNREALRLTLVGCAKVRAVNPKGERP